MLRLSERRAAWPVSGLKTSPVWPYTYLGYYHVILAKLSSQDPSSDPAGPCYNGIFEQACSQGSQSTLKILVDALWYAHLQNTLQLPFSPFILFHSPVWFPEFLMQYSSGWLFRSFTKSRCVSPVLLTDNGFSGRYSVGDELRASYMLSAALYL